MISYVNTDHLAKVTNAPLQVKDKAQDQPISIREKINLTQGRLNDILNQSSRIRNATNNIAVYPPSPVIPNDDPYPINSMSDSIDDINKKLYDLSQMLTEIETHLEKHL
jgi:hypothetical protein